jgi:16S rRNA (cytosine967-C5)-methyltransferase
MSVAPARWAAFGALHAVNAGRLDLPEALVDSRSRLRDERDQALAAEIAAGTLRWQGELDYLVAHYADRPLSRIEPEILDILRLSAYQLLHLDRVPAAAAVDDAVTLTRRVGKAGASGFVNAVLRSISRNRHRLPLPQPPSHAADPTAQASPDLRGATLDYLSITLSHPRWLMARWLDRVGPAAAEAWARFDNTAAPLTLRANTLRIAAADLAFELGRHGVRTRPTRYAPHGLVVLEGSPLRTPLAAAGLFVVQDEASQLVPAMVAAQPGERILDGCAAPGGKTTAMAADMNDRGLLVAADVRARRVRLLRQIVALSRASSVRVVQADLRRPLPFGPTFDCVLVDAPCSGLGTIRRDPEIRWRRSEQQLPSFAAIQATMLSQASRVVRPGGRLVYATCSSEPEENEQVLAAFLDLHADFEHEDPRRVLGRLHERVRPVINGAGHLETRPDLHGLEAFFAAVLRRKEPGGRLVEDQPL